MSGRWGLLVLTILLLVLSTPVWSADQTINPGDNLQSALGQLQPGDTLTLNGGTYTCSGCFDNMPGGTSSARVTVKAAQIGAVTIQLQSSGNGITLSTARSSYITFDGVRFDASGVRDAGIKITCSGTGDYAHHIRLVNVEVFGAHTQGILANAGQCNSSNQGFNEVINADIHHNGSDPQFDHGLYFASSDNLIENSRIHDNTGCGIHIYASSGSADRNVVRGNRVSGHTGSCGVGILMGSGDDNLASNNVAEGNNGGIMVGNGGRNNQVVNNTVVSNRQWCLVNNNTNTTIRDNLCAGNGTDTLLGSGDGTSTGNVLGAAVSFVDAAGGDFRVAGGSAAGVQGVVGTGPGGGGAPASPASPTLSPTTPPPQQLAPVPPLPVAPPMPPPQSSLAPVGPLAGLR